MMECNIPQVGGYIYIVAEVNSGKVLGWSRIYGGSIKDLWIHPDFQRRGLGSQLLKYMETLLRQEARLEFFNLSERQVLHLFLYY